jgi:diguanylate cyclase (GGDEF)-like protein
MHLVLSRTGHIVHAGPTLSKIRPHECWVGQRFLEVFALKRPRSISSAKDLHAIVGSKLHLQLRDAPKTKMKGVLVPGPFAGELVVNLSFGISVVDVVRDYGLDNDDFAPTDLAIELLYLVEAKSVAMEASQKLNVRLQAAMIAAEEKAFSDTLTGLKNRRAFDFILERQIHADNGFALMQIDLDFFKVVNDSFGHGAGDHVLQTVANILTSETRETDTVARLGGDEFVILLPDIHDTSVLIGIGQRIISRLEVPIPFKDNICQISASIGTVLRTVESSSTAKDLQEEADIALYASKRAGRAKQTFFSERLKRNAWSKDFTDRTEQRQSIG